LISTIGKTNESPRPARVFFDTFAQRPGRLGGKEASPMADGRRGATGKNVISYTQLDSARMFKK
jgi:hypothetical protein